MTVDIVETAEVDEATEAVKADACALVPITFAFISRGSKHRDYYDMLGELGRSQP